MIDYEVQVRSELSVWEKEMLKEAWLLERMSKKLQQKVDRIIPEKIHQSMSKAMEITVKSVLSGIDMLPFSEQRISSAKKQSLQEQDRSFAETLGRYKKLAAAEGIGTGAGGILLAAVDYPALLAIKLKFLAETAQTYGFDIRQFNERVYCLKVFQLAFSSDASRKRIYEQIKNWNANDSLALSDASVEGFVSWREFYTEYKESIEFKKMLSFLPIVGAVFNGWGNFALLDDLGKTAQNAYRLRVLKQ